jgi:hypothetical protein
MQECQMPYRTAKSRVGCLCTIGGNLDRPNDCFMSRLQIPKLKANLREVA